MEILQDRVLRLFDDAWPSWTSAEIARALVCPHDEVLGVLRRMSHSCLVYCLEQDGTLTVTLNPEGMLARDLFLTESRQRLKEGVA